MRWRKQWRWKEYPPMLKFYHFESLECCHTYQSPNRPRWSA